MPERPYAGHPGLAVLLGEAAADGGILEALGAVDVALGQWLDALRVHDPDTVWWTRGLQITEFAQPPHKPHLVAGINGPVRFLVELARGDRYANYRALGRAPEAFYVEAEVYVDPPPCAPPHEGEVLAFELPITRHATARSAVTALVRAVER